MVGLGPFIYFGYQFRSKAMKNKPKDYEFPMWSDFKYALLFAVIIGICDAILYNIAYRLFKPFCKEQDDLLDRNKRSKKAAYSFFKLIYFTLMSIWGYIILFDKNFFPPLLGGSGDLYNCADGFPYQDEE